ncbi:MAG: DUF1697 domain-containing protein [Anaerolineales bacterium]
MTRYLAFLRAINVGGHVVKMETLRRLFEALGFANVETFIASGNVIFESPARNAATLEHKIEKELETALGYAVATFLRSPTELAAIAQHHPFGKLKADEVVYVAFARAAPNAAARAALKALNNPAHTFHLNGREVYWLRRRQLDDGKYSGATLERALAAPATVRNMTTVEKMAAKYADPDLAR